MPRPLRPIADGLVYHVINRGNNRQPVFLDDGDCFAFLKAIGELKQRKPFELYGYCLMGNHVHLLLRRKRRAKHVLCGVIGWCSSAEGVSADGLQEACDEHGTFAEAGCWQGAAVAGGDSGAGEQRPVGAGVLPPGRGEGSGVLLVAA